MDAMEIMVRNRCLLQRARELNVRAGEKIFMEMSHEEIGRWLKERLGGARRMVEVKNLAAIAFPELEQGMVDLVVGENPDEIIVLAKSLKVEYRDGFAPRINLYHDTISVHGWRELPDAGVELPGGRLVEVVVSFGYYDAISGQNIPELKSRCVSRANKSLWDNWSTESRPAIALPDPSDPTSIVPEIIECQYGVSVIDGSALVAYGAVTIKSSRWYASDPWFEGKWFQVREEADATRTKSAAKLESIREEAIRQKQMDEVRAMAKAAQESLQNLQSREGWYDLDGDLRSRVDNRRYECLPYGLEDLLTWTEATNAIVAEAEVMFKAKADAKAAEEARIAAAEKSGHLVRKLEVTCDTRYGRGHVWVIRPDGTTREHDGYGDGGRRRYTCYVWNMISDELVIVHEVTSVNGVDFASSNTGVLWRPQVVTQAQIAMVERLEGEYGLGGTFEVDPGLVAKRAKMMDEIRKEIVHVSPKEYVKDLKFLDVSSFNGYQTRHENPRRLVNWAKPFNSGCEGRNAQVVKTVRCADGMLEFLAYEKWGATNLNARWRPLTDEEKAVPEPTAAPKAEVKPASAEQVTTVVADLQARFGKKR